MTVSNDAAAVIEDFYGALAFGVAAILQSPHFLFRVETGVSTNDAHIYTDHEMASRLSFFLWNRPPDDALLSAADRGELTDDAMLNEHIEQMRLSATKAILSRRDTIIVASVSAIYGLGDPESYFQMVMHFVKGDRLNQRDLLRQFGEALGGRDNPHNPQSRSWIDKARAFIEEHMS